MKRIVLISRPRTVTAFLGQGVFLTAIEIVLSRAWEEMSDKGGKSPS